MEATADKEFLIRVKADIDAAVKDMRRLTGEMNKQGSAAGKEQRALGGLGLRFAALTAAAAAYLSVQTAIGSLRIADEYRLTQFRLERVTRAQGDYNQVSAQLFDIAQKNGVALKDTANLFININRAAADMGATRQQVIAVSAAVQQLGLISGASGVELNNALRQFGQSMASGVVRAEEFNSIIENTPEIASRIAKGMGLTTGQLRLAVVEGEVLSKQVFESLLKQAPEIAKEMGEVPDTVDRATQRLQNSFQRFIGQINEATGLSRGLASVLSGIAKTFDSLSGDSLDDLAKKIDALQSGRGGPQGRNRSGRGALLNSLYEERDDLLKALPGVQGITAQLTEIEDKLRVANEHRAAVEEQLAAIAIDDRVTHQGAGRNRSLTPFGRLNVELSAANAELESLSADRSNLLDTLFALDIERDQAAAGSGPADTGPSDEEKSRAKRIQSIVDGLKQQSETYGQTSEQIALYRLALEGATPAQIRHAKALVADIEAQRAAEEASRAALESAEELARQQEALNESLERQAQHWRDATNPANVYQRQLEEIERLYADGRISAETYAEATLQVMDAFDRIGDKADETGDDLNQFAIQAARNIQSQIGETLASAATSSFDEILLSWVNLLQRMVSEAIAAQIAQALFGEGFSKTGEIGGYVGSFLSAVGVFHSGGIVGQSAPATRQISPLAFMNAPRYHTGGFPGLKSDESPVITQKGEEILSRTDPRNALNGSSGNAAPQSLQVALFDDRSSMGDYLGSPQGQQVVVEAIRRNAGSIRRVLGN